MSYLIPLLLSIFIINGVHGFLLASQKSKRKFSISEHAVLNTKAYLLYVIGHILGGGFFLIFAYLYYMNILNIQWLFWLSVVTVMLEYVQALLPARGKTNHLHTVIALSMWASFLCLGLLTIIFVPTSVIQCIAASILYLFILISLIKAYRDRQRIYRYQMIMVILCQMSVFIVVA